MKPLLIAVACGLAVAGPLAAQAGPAREATVGVVAGWASSEQVWSRDAETAPRGGPVVGIGFESPLPGAALSLRAGFQWTRRGSEVLSDLDGAPVDGVVQADYFTVPLDLLFGIGAGPARLYGTVGFELDQLVAHREDAVLAQVLDEPAATVFSAAAGAGLSMRSGGTALGVEMRWVEGLSKSHSAAFVTMRTRSAEALLRVTVPISRFREGGP